MSRWAFWRQRPPAAGAAQSPSPAMAPRPVALYLPLDALQVVLAWLLPSGAVVVGALGQFMLALVLLAIAFGVWLRLWRGRQKRRAMARAMGRTPR
ncbi:MAG: hypothetical protein HEQ37_18840 [Acidovorax sp.]|nr:hypothetical protein [Acidovorax sp.]